MQGWTIKDKSVQDVTETEEIKKRWQKYTEEYKKGHNDPDKHNSVVTHLELEIVECEVKWALRSITINKASGGDRIPAELFEILKDEAVKVPHFSKYARKFGRISRGHRTRRGQFPFQSQRKAMPKNAQTTTQLHSYRMPAK